MGGNRLDRSVSFESVQGIVYRVSEMVEHRHRRPVRILELLGNRPRQHSHFLQARLFAQATTFSDNTDHSEVTLPIAPQLRLIRSSVKLDLDAALGRPYAIQNEVGTSVCPGDHLSGSDQKGGTLLCLPRCGH